MKNKFKSSKSIKIQSKIWYRHPKFLYSRMTNSKTYHLKEVFFHNRAMKSIKINKLCKITCLKCSSSSRLVLLSQFTFSNFLFSSFSTYHCWITWKKMSIVSNFIMDFAWMEQKNACSTIQSLLLKGINCKIICKISFFRTIKIL